MKFWAYARSHLGAGLVFAAALALAAFVLVMVDTSWEVVALVLGIACAGGVLALVLGYLGRREFYAELANFTDAGADPLWASEFMERPDFAEGAVTFDAMAALAKTANDEVAAAQRQMGAYREYVETWVHEAKSPLAAAHLMVENLRADGLDGEGIARLAALDEELDRTEGYIEQALFYARSEALDRDYLIRRYRLRDVVAAAVKANARALIGVRMTPELGALDMTVFTDEKWLLFILGQVIQNSVKYARESDARISFAAVVEGAGTAGERVVLRVEDNGCGVGAEDLPRVFDKGFTGAAGRTGKRSTGIGLYLVKRLCDKMNIDVWADSVPGESFAVSFGFSTNKYRYFEA